jgi:hypothetical protein
MSLPMWQGTEEDRAAKQSAREGEGGAAGENKILFFAFCLNLCISYIMSSAVVNDNKKWYLRSCLDFYVSYT